MTDRVSASSNSVRLRRLLAAALCILGLLVGYLMVSTIVVAYGAKWLPIYAPGVHWANMIPAGLVLAACLALIAEVWLRGNERKTVAERIVDVFSLVPQ